MLNYHFLLYAGIQVPVTERSIMPNWTTNDMPDQTGKVVVITGANSGLGYETALALAQKNAQVIIACRNTQKGEKAAKQIVSAVPTAVPNAALNVMPLDLADLESISDFAAAFKSQYTQLDQLYNNAGVMAIPRRETADGFEMQFGVNHLGHFALTGHLLPHLLKTPNSRIVTISSMGHRFGKINFDDLQSEASYTRYWVYCRSKLANVLFMLELHRRLSAIETSTISVGAHPGYSVTNLHENTTNASGSTLEKLVYKVINTVISQSSEKGALPQLYAGTAPDVTGGQFFGPHLLGFRGDPVLEKPSATARNQADAARLWQVSEQLTGVHYETLSKESFVAV
jgi:NAD(P)-dependent dehydrogenase (short-subunit alcohol dehydrogenase family)